MINYDYCSNNCLLMTSIQFRIDLHVDKRERITAMQWEIKYSGDDVCWRCGGSTSDTSVHIFTVIVRLTAASLK